MVENYIWMAGQNQECLPTDWTEVEDKDACNGIEGNWLNRTGFTLKKDQHKKKLNYLSSLPQCFNTFLLKETSVTYHASNLLKKRKKKFIFCFAAAAAKSLQSCPTLCDPMDYSPRGFSVHGIFQTRGLEWDAIAFSNKGQHSSGKTCVF